MRRAPALALLTLVGLAGNTWARPARSAERTLADATAAPDPNKRIVVTEGDGKTGRLVDELEQELKASSYVVVRMPKVAIEPEAMLQTLQKAQATRGVLLSQDGKSVTVLAASRDGTRLRVYGDYALDRDNRLTRRRQWIALVERLRAAAEDDDDAKEDVPWVEPVEPLAPSPPFTAKRPPQETTPGEPDARASDDALDPHADRLGLSVALGYVTGRTGLTSHLLIVGYHQVSPRLSLVAQGLWPMVPGERTSTDGTRSRVWTFAGALGLQVDLGRPSWSANPYLGTSVGMQFLLAYVDRYQDAITDVYRLASLTLDTHTGVRLAIRQGTWLLVQVSGGRAVSLAPRPGEMTASLSDTWIVRGSVGLLMAL
jgi:hypothetical protein